MVSLVKELCRVVYFSVVCSVGDAQGKSLPFMPLATLLSCPILRTGQDRGPHGNESPCGKRALMSTPVAKTHSHFLKSRKACTRRDDLREG